MMDTVTHRRNRLHHTIREMESVLVTFSGGIDSTLLAAVAHRELGDRAAALTAVSPSLAASELEECRRLAHGIGITHISVETHELDDYRYSSNPANRCYFCKEELFSVALSEAEKRGFRVVVEGTHAEDLKGHRPGFQAARELGVRSPFVELGFTKQEIRNYARDLGLPNWDKPALACLASRFPTGTPITLERLNQVQHAEEVLRTAAVRRFRARYHGDLLRIEVEENEIGLVADPTFRRMIRSGIEECGFRFVTWDLIPYGEPRSNCHLALPLDRDHLLRRVQSRLEREGIKPCVLGVVENMLKVQVTEPDLERFAWDTDLRNRFVEYTGSLGFRFTVLDLSVLEQPARTSATTVPSRTL